MPLLGDTEWPGSHRQCAHLHDSGRCRTLRAGSRPCDFTFFGPAGAYPTFRPILSKAVSDRCSGTGAVFPGCALAASMRQRIP